MSNKKGLVIVAAAVVAAFPTSAWWLGTMIESAHQTQYEQIANLPYLKVISRDYQRGLFSASETVALEVSREWLQALNGESVSEPLGVPDESLRITVKTAIAHGPLPHFSTLAAGFADTRLIFSEEVSADIAKLIGNQDLIKVATTYGFGGGGVVGIASPAFKVTLPADDAIGGAGQLTWGGMTANVDFSRGMTHYTLTADMPTLEIRQGDGQMQLSGMRLSADQKRLFDDAPMFYVGAMQMDVARLNVVPFEQSDETPPVLFERMRYDVAMPVRGDFIDLLMKIGTDTLKVGDQNFGPAHYDISLRNLHARTAATLHGQLMALYGDTSMQTAEDPSALLEPLVEPALALLGHNPELGLDQLSFATPHGNTRFAARARFDGLTPEETQNPFAMVQKLDASGEISLPERFLAQLQANAADSPEEAQLMAEMFSQQVDELAAQGFLKREAGILSTRFAFKNGALTVNDLPFNPMSMGGGQ